MRILFILLITLAYSNSHAQSYILNKILKEKQKSSTTTNTKETKPKEETQENETEDDDINNAPLWLQQLQQNQQNVKYEPSYTFNLFTKIKTEITEKGKTETAISNYYSSPNATMVNMKELDNAKSNSEEGNIILDKKNKCMITLNEKDKEGFVMNTSGFEKFANQYAEKHTPTTTTQPNITVKKTGRTKTILGYTCEEYLIKSNDPKDKQEIYSWVTKDASLSFFDLFGASEKYKQQSTAYKGQINGAVLEMITKETDTGDSFKMTVLEINKNSFTKKLSDYKIQSGFGKN